MDESGLWIYISMKKKKLMVGKGNSLESLVFVVERSYIKVSEMGEWGKWFQDNIIWQLEDGNRILFWEDIWLKNILLRDKYPKLYAN